MKISTVTPLTPISLLKGITHNLNESLNRTANIGIKAEETRKRFIWGYADHICSLLMNVMLLDTNMVSFGARLCVRPMMECFFNLAAACNRDDFAGKKVAWELYDQKNRIEKWKAFPFWNQAPVEFQNDIDESQKTLDVVMKQNNLTDSPKKINIAEIAAISNLEQVYLMDYFFLCSYTHVNFANLDPSHNQYTRGYLIRVSTFIAMNSLNLFQNFFYNPLRAEHHAELLATADSLRRLTDGKQYDLVRFRE